MRTRVIFGVVGAAYVLLCIFAFPPSVLYISLAVLCMMATYELIGPTRLVRDRYLVVACMAASLLYALGEMFVRWVWFGELFSMLLLFALFGYLLARHDRLELRAIICAYFGTIVLTDLLLSLARLFDMKGGRLLVLIPLVIAWGSDSFAYFAGRAFGRHKLAPVISPKKTVEGAVGGVLGAMVLVLVLMIAFNRPEDQSLPLWGAVLLGAVGAAIGQIGDLSFSIIKRQCGIKDYSQIFPGHGGVLDRFDSVIFVAPVVELLLRWLAYSFGKGTIL